MKKILIFVLSILFLFSCEKKCPEFSKLIDDKCICDEGYNNIAMKQGDISCLKINK